MTPSDLVNKWHLGGWLTWHHPSGHTLETPVALLYELEGGQWLYVPPGYELDWPVFGERTIPGPLTIEDGVIVFPEGTIEDTEKTDHPAVGMPELFNHLARLGRSQQEEWERYRAAQNYPFK